MSWIRDFSAREGHLPPLRNVDDSTPDRMRQELVDAFYVVANGAAGRLDADRDLYLIIEQSLRVQAAGNPQSGRRHRVGHDIAAVEWQRVYDLIVRLWVEFRRVGLHTKSIAKMSIEFSPRTELFGGLERMPTCIASSNRGSKVHQH
jgi:hypothetical protein